jgi:hypothetical protein
MVDCCDDDSTFLDARIAAVEATIVAFEAAVLALNTGVQSYELDTGQTRQRVTKADLIRLSGMIDSLMNRRQTLRALRCGGATHVTPSY